MGYAFHLLRPLRLVCSLVDSCLPNRTPPLLQSGKLVMRMFQKIQELIDDKESLVCVLIDEVGEFNGILSNVRMEYEKNPCKIVFNSAFCSAA